MRSSTRKHQLRAAVFAAAVVFTALAGPVRSAQPALPPGDRPPPDVFSRIDDAGVAADHQGADRIVVYDYAMNRVKLSGVTTVEAYTIHKALTPAGCKSLAVLRWNYDPQSSYVEVKEVNVVRDGKRIPVDISRVRDLPAPQAAIYWKDRIKTLQLPRLRVNDGVEVRTFRKGFTYALLDEAALSAGPEDRASRAAQSADPQDRASVARTGEEPGDERYIPPMPGEYFDIVFFADDVPIVEKKYVLSLPSEKRLHSEVYNGPLYSGTSYDEERTEYAWWGFDLSAIKEEPRQPDRSDFTPKVVMATVESWQAKSRWFFDINENQFDVTPGIKEKVEEIFEAAGATRASEERKAEILVHWVAQNIRYSGQTMGKGEGFTLHPGHMIFEQRSGVCKDIAGMLITMMRAAGLDSYGAMTMAGSRIEEVPADQFNHCVCALRKDDGSFEMYDPTWVPYNNNIWSLLEAEQHYLVGSPEGEPLSRIPYSPAAESPLRIENDATLSEAGTLEGTLRLSGSGALDGRLRRIIAGTRRHELEHALAAILSHASERVEGIQYEYHDPADFSRDMWITVRYRIPRFARQVDGGLEFTSPMMRAVLADGNLFRAAASSWEEKRETDVFLYYTQLVEGTENIRLPNGYAAVDPPVSEEVDETYAYFKGESRMTGRRLTITQHAEIRRRQVPPDGYTGFKRALDEARKFSGRLYRVEKGGRSS